MATESWVGSAPSPVSSSRANRRAGALSAGGIPDAVGARTPSISWWPRTAVMAADLAVEASHGRMVALRGTYTHVPIGVTKEGVKRVDVDELYDPETYLPKVRHVLGKPMFLY